MLFDSLTSYKPSYCPGPLMRESLTKLVVKPTHQTIAPPVVKDKQMVQSTLTECLAHLFNGNLKATKHEYTKAKTSLRGVWGVLPQLPRLRA